MLITNSNRLENFKENEVIRISKEYPKPKILDNVTVQAKTKGLDMNFASRRKWGEVKGEVTHQYLKFVNAHLLERLEHINKMKEIKNSLDSEIELLQTNDITNLMIFPDIPINELNQNEITELSEYMKLQKEIAEAKIDYYKNKINSANEELQEREWQLQEIDKKQSKRETESEKIVKEELNSLLKKYGIKELTYAIDVITSTKRRRKSD